MEKVAFAATDLLVSPLGLGTANFGTRIDEATSLRQLDRYTQLGNLVDTAHVYGDWEPGMTACSEKIIGKWLAAHGGRDRIVLSTKGAHPPINAMHISRVTPEEIRLDLEGSLRCLRTDYIDLYFLHRDDPSRPVGELLECLEVFCAEGKIRYYGCSNWTLPRLKAAQQYAAAHGLKGFVCNQLMWSLAEVRVENLQDKTLVAMDAPTYAFHAQTHLNATCYTSLAKGYFSHRQRGDTLSQSTRDVYDTAQNDVIYAKLLDLSERYGVSITLLSLLYFSAQPFAAVPLAAFRNDAQMEESLQLLELTPPQALLEELKTIRTIEK